MSRAARVEAFSPEMIPGSPEHIAVTKEADPFQAAGFAEPCLSAKCADSWPRSINKKKKQLDLKFVHTVKQLKEILL